MDEFQLWTASLLAARITVGDIIVYAIAGFVVLALANVTLAIAGDAADKERRGVWRRQHVDLEDDRNNSR